MSRDPSFPVPNRPVPNTVFRALRGARSPGEFAAAVRRAGREIGERVSCDARYVGRVEAGEIRCPNYAYERVFLHMFPGYTLTDLGFAPRETVRGRRAHALPYAPPHKAVRRPVPDPAGTGTTPDPSVDEESDVLRRAFMTGGSAALAGLALGTTADPAAASPTAASPGFRPGTDEAEAVEEAVRHIRLLDDRHGADALYEGAGRTLRAAYELVDAGARRQSVTDRLHAGAGELAISVGWLAHDSRRYTDARSHYAEALATARVAGDPALEAHAFCNMAFLARDAGRPHEAVRAAQAAQAAARRLGSARLRSLLALREAGGWAGLGDRRACGEALGRAADLFALGTADADPAWMSFYGEAELAGLEAQCWSALGDHERAADRARRAVALLDPHFTRNIALFTAQLADDLAASGKLDEAAAAGGRAVRLLGGVKSTRIRRMLDATADRLRAHGSPVDAFLGGEPRPA
ncbi:hypothetical protein SRB5_40670 [Streptomyces sp. RB5]|uniref:C1 regulatory protein n=1 Tax=Streptomyces smaragdinus TaxID=2585196 RepID=A0A7K0CK83_9ACTN|nr:hypothetical protein [Streptomyces smaragdinus]